MIGQILGNYRLCAELGKGGMAQVYLAEHVAIGSQAAVKVLLPTFSRNTAMLERFFNEARVTAAVRHPGIVEIFDYGLLEDGRAFLVMEYLRGETLHDRMKREKRLPLDMALHLIRQITLALGAAHRVGIVHRDLKPDNIFLVPDEEVWSGERAKILDFGIAKANMDAFGDRSLTKTGVIIGTPDYMPPEQCQGRSDIDHRADLYSLGCILFKLLTGRTPFADHATGEVIACHVLREPPRPDTLVTGIPPNVTALIMRLLEKDPNDRFAGADELLSVLERLGSASSHGMAIGSLGHTGPSGVVPHTAITQAGHVAARARTASVIQQSPVLAPEPHRDTGRTPMSTLSSAAQYHTVVQPDLPPPRPRRMGRYVLAGAIVVAMVTAAAISAVELFPPASSPDQAARATPIFPAKKSASSATPGGDADNPAAGDVATQEAEPEDTMIELEIRTLPGGAKVYMMPDGALLGQTPITLERPKQAGKYELLLKLDGYEELTVLVDADQSAKYSRDLERLPTVADNTEQAAEKASRKSSKKSTRKRKPKRRGDKPKHVERASQDTGLLGLD